MLWKTKRILDQQLFSLKENYLKDNVTLQHVIGHNVYTQVV